MERRSRYLATSPLLSSRSFATNSCQNRRYFELGQWPENPSSKLTQNDGEPTWNNYHKKSFVLQVLTQRLITFRREKLMSQVILAWISLISYQILGRPTHFSNCWCRRRCEDVLIWKWGNSFSLGTLSIVSTL